MNDARRTVVVLGNSTATAPSAQVLRAHLDPATTRVLDVVIPADATDIAALAAPALHENPLVICIEQDVPVDLAVDLCRLVDLDHGDVSVVVVTRADRDRCREMLRAGAREVIGARNITVELPAAIDVALERSERLRARLAPVEEVDRSRVVVVISPKGGSGKTTVSVNLTAALAARNPGSVVLVDFDTMFGDTATALGLQPERHLGQLVGTTLDATTLKVYLTHDERTGAFVLAAPEDPDEGEAVTEETAREVLDLLAADFGTVVVDTAGGLDDRAVAAIDRATDIVLVAGADVTSIRSLQKAIGVLDGLGATAARRWLVVNRADERSGLAPEDIVTVLGLPATVTIPNTPEIPLALNQGRAFVQNDPTSEASREICRLAGALLGRSHDDGRPRPQQAWRGLLRRR